MIIIDTLGWLKSKFDGFRKSRAIRNLYRLSDAEKCKLSFSVKYFNNISEREIAEWMENKIPAGHVGAVLYLPSERNCSIVQLMICEEENVEVVKTVALFYSMNISSELQQLFSQSDNILVIKHN